MLLQLLYHPPHPITYTWTYVCTCTCAHTCTSTSSLAGSFHPSSSLYQAGLPRFSRVGSTALILSLSLKLFPQLSIDSPYVNRQRECLDARFWRASLPGFKYWLCHLLPAGSWANAFIFCVSVLSSEKRKDSSLPPPLLELLCGTCEIMNVKHQEKCLAHSILHQCLLLIFMSCWSPPTLL